MQFEASSRSLMHLVISSTLFRWLQSSWASGGRDLRIWYLKTLHCYTLNRFGDFVATKFVSQDLSFQITAHIKDKHSGKVEKCDKCDFTSIGPRHKLVIHKKMQHGLSSFICPMCDFKTYSSEELEQHKQGCNSSQKVVITPAMRHEQKRKGREALMEYTCKICKLPFNTRQMLAIHIKADHKGIRYNCSEGNCKFSFKTRGSLNIHINNKHLGIKHRCKICNYEAGQKYKIRKHMVIKHNTETFSCNACSYRCPDSERMQKHVLLRHHNLSV